MALTKISRSLLDTGVSDSSDATAITIDSSENVGLGARLSVGTTTVGGGNTKIVATGGTDNYLQLVSNTGSGGISLGNAGANLLIYTHTGALGSESFTERMRITSDGNVGVGTTDTNSHRMAIDSGSGTSLGLMHKSSNAFTLMTFKASGTSQDIRLGAVGNDMIFQTNGTERMRIDSNGKILMKLTSSISDETLQVRTNQAIGYGILVDETASAGGTFMRFRVNGNIVGQIYGNGSATTYATSSDYRLKENISYDWDATTRLKNLKPARFNFKTDSSTTVDGFLAHEVSSVVPEAIGGEKDAVDSEGEPIYQSIDHSKLVPLLVKTIQELEARITTLEGE